LPTHSSITRFKQHEAETKETHLEEINHSAGVKTGLLISSIHQRRLGTFLREQLSVQVKFQSLGDLVLQLDSGAEDIGSGPRLCEGQSIFGIVVFRFHVTRDAERLVITHSSNFECHIGGGFSFDFKGSAEDGEVLAQQVVGRLSEVLHTQSNTSVTRFKLGGRREYIPSSEVARAGG